MYELPPVEPPNVQVVAPMPKVTTPMFGLIGFVDDVRQTLLLTPVKIVHPGTKTYGWMNVWTSRNTHGAKTGCRFAQWLTPQDCARAASTIKSAATEGLPLKQRQRIL